MCVSSLRKYTYGFSANILPFTDPGRMLAPHQPQQPHVAAGAGSTGPAQQRPAMQVAPRDTQSTASQGQIHRQVCNSKACRKHAEDVCMVRLKIIARFTLTLQLLLLTGGAGSRCKCLHGTQLVESVQQVKPKHARTHTTALRTFNMCKDRSKLSYITLDSDQCAPIVGSLAFHGSQQIFIVIFLE